MDEQKQSDQNQIIPVGPKLFQQNKKPPKPEQITQLEVPQFNIPQQSPSPEQPTQQITEPEPEKKKNWKIWMIIAVVIIIAAGLGFYFLSS